MIDIILCEMISAFKPFITCTIVWFIAMSLIIALFKFGCYLCNRYGIFVCGFVVLFICYMARVATGVYLKVMI